MGYYLAVKREEVLTQAVILINIKNILLIERSQTQGSQVGGFCLYDISRLSKSLETIQIGDRQVLGVSRKGE